MSSPRVVGALWPTMFLALMTFTLWRLDLLPFTVSVPVNGAGTIPRAFFSVDHPFHTARADLLRNAWSALDTVRWIGSHQGGYPAEFYPFGAQAMAAAANFASFGLLAIETSWALTIALILLLPGLAYLLIGKLDRLSPAVAIVALGGQVAIASAWTHGGFTELVEWGLATNVAGFTWALVALPLLAGAVERSSPRFAGFAALTIALCAVTNPRALLAVAVIGIAVLVDAALRQNGTRSIMVTAGVALLSAGLAAPLLLPLVRYRDLYFFLGYQEYADTGVYWSETVASVTWPVLALAGVGVALAVIRGSRASRVVAISLVLYMSMTAVFVASESLRELIPQLELPRLMPFQRLLIIYLAAFGLVEGARRIIRLPSRWHVGQDALLAISAIATLLVVFTSSAGAFLPAEQGLREVPRTEGQDAVELWQFERAVAIADERAPDGTAILVIGSRLSWHEQLWAPMKAPDRRFYYNDWLWYWHQQHAGPYDYRQGHAYPDASLALTRAYFDRHGIGAVVVTDIADRSSGTNARQAASRAPELARADTIGAWDVYTVNESVGLATLDGDAPSALDISNDGESIHIDFNGAESGTVTVRQNWFPRWEARVNGNRVPVVRGEDGYMQIDVPEGDVEIVLHYDVTPVDVAARALAAISIGVTVALLLGVRPSRRWVRR